MSGGDEQGLTPESELSTLDVEVLGEDEGTNAASAIGSFSLTTGSSCFAAHETSLLCRLDDIRSSSITPSSPRSRSSNTCVL